MDYDGLIQTIDNIYFQSEDTFNLDHLIDNLPQDVTSDYLFKWKSRLEKLLTVVDIKVSELILKNQPTYVDELQRIADLQKSITESIRVCTQGRSYLSFIKTSACNGMAVVEHFKKRQALSKLLDSLVSISNLRKSTLR